MKETPRIYGPGVDRIVGYNRFTRKVDDLVQAMGMSEISKSQVSQLCQP